MTSPRPARVQYPRRTKIIVAVVLAVALGALTLGFLRAETDDGTVAVSGAGGEVDADVPTVSTGVQERIPEEGDQILGQETIGIDLAPGWTGELLLLEGNGRAIRLPDDELEFVDELNQILYQPAEGKTVERLSGDYCIAATIWDQVRGREATERVENWCFNAT